MAKYGLKRKVKRRLCSLRKYILLVWDRILACSLGRPVYLALQNPTAGDMISPSSETNAEANLEARRIPSCINDSDLVLLKISLLGDCQIGKTRFMEKYVGNKKEDHGIMQGNGLNLMGKTLKLNGARISYNIWEVENKQRVSLACGDAVAILVMFDLTSRVTLNSVINWYEEARKWNQTGIAIMVGTKFDEFIQLPIDVQWAMASQARAYAKALNAPLFFSSATYNINVNKVFKFVTAKLFDLPWPLERNLTIGEPIIDF